MNEEKLKAIKYLYDRSSSYNDEQKKHILNFIGLILYDKMSGLSESDLEEIVNNILNW